MMEKIRVVIEKIIFQNPDDGYSVIEATAGADEKKITLVGTFSDVVPGSVLLVSGEWRNDKKYGMRFSVTDWEIALPATARGIEKYLGSGLVRGIGEEYAKRIVKTFGTATLDIIDKEPERLTEVEGIGKKRAETIKKNWREHKEIRNIMVFLKSYDVTTSIATKIYMKYGNSSIEKVSEDPYRLCDEITGVGFLTADRIALAMNTDKNAASRCKSGLMYAMGQISAEGASAAERRALEERTRELIDADPERITAALDLSIEEGSLISEDGYIFLPYIYNAECGIARNLERINSKPSFFSYVPDISAIEKETGTIYEENQRDAIIKACENKIMILTGGPGTGKTTTLLGIIKALERSGEKIILCAPTGRAAKRMSETTGKEAKTIHRLLCYSPQGGFKKGYDDRLPRAAVIVDECSMIDTLLMNALLRAIDDDSKIIFTGDVDQLPSIGPGRVLSDIIESGEFTVVRLDKIFRQAEKSEIIKAAHMVNRGIMPPLSNGKGSDMFFIEEKDPKMAAVTITSLISDRLPKYLSASPFDIQVLSPMMRGDVGCDSLNDMIREKINPTGRSIAKGGRIFRERDRVMQTRNNYDNDVYNGDMGRVKKVDTEKRTVTVDFYGRDVEYDYQMLDELSASYAVTIHKSQGSEFDAVIIPITTSHYIMLARNLLYTGITRAKKLLVLIGTREALSYCLSEKSIKTRITKLKERIRKELPSEFVKETDKIDELLFDADISI